MDLANHPATALLGTATRVTRCLQPCIPFRAVQLILPRSTVLVAAPRLQQSVLPCRAARIVAAATAAPTGQVLTSTEVPAFIPRDDMADQMVRWAYIQAADNTVSNFGLPFKVEEVFREDDGRLWGAKLHFLRNGETCTTLYIGFDEDVVLKHEWLGMNDLGFPVPEGNSTEIQGKNFTIRKVCDSKVDEQLREAIKKMCRALVTVINRYYAFGSVFVDDAT